jgi:S-adenosylmethionine:tRNA ribosyltransferase-isomerase
MQKLQDAGARIERVELIVGLDSFKQISTDDPLDHVIHSEYFHVEPAVLQTCKDAKRVIAVGTTACRALESSATLGQPSGRTSLFITPGYEWKVVDTLLTNFHMPKTSLLLMIESFVGRRWRDLYAEAIEEKYRFLSFGDAMLLDRKKVG